MCDKNSRATKTGGITTCSCQSTRVWQRRCTANWWRLVRWRCQTRADFQLHRMFCRMRDFAPHKLTSLLVALKANMLQSTQQRAAHSCVSINQYDLPSPPPLTRCVRVPTNLIPLPATATDFHPQPELNINLAAALTR